MGAATLQAARNQAGEDSFNIESMRRSCRGGTRNASRYSDKPEKGEWGETLEAALNATMGIEDPRTLNQNLVMKQEC